MENLFGKNEDFEYLDFRHAQTKDDKSAIYYCPRNAEDGNGRSCYAVVFSSKITKEVRDKRFFYVRIRANRMTGEIYFVISNENHYDSLNVRPFECKITKKCVHNKRLVEYIMQTIGIEKGGRVIREIEIGPNISSIDDALVYKLLGVGQ